MIAPEDRPEGRLAEFVLFPLDCGRAALVEPVRRTSSGVFSAHAAPAAIRKNASALPCFPLYAVQARLNLVQCLISATH